MANPLLNQLFSPGLAQLAATPAGQDQYRAMSVADRLAMLQGASGPLSPADETLLRLLRQRREREAAAGLLRPMPQKVQALGAPGPIGRTLDARQQLLDALARR